jgi:membrane-associated protein
MSLLSIFTSFGIFGLGAIIIVETGFLPAFFLPGDSLLFSAGYFINQGKISIQYAILVLGLCAFLGNVLGYFMGQLAEHKIEIYVERHKEKFGPAFEKTKRFFKKYGLLTLIIARFIPIVRSVAPFLSGVTQIKKIPFFFVSFISGFIWVTVGLALGNFFGNSVPDMDHFVSLIVIVAVGFALVPIFWPLIKKIIGKK